METITLRGINGKDFSTTSTVQPLIIRRKQLILQDHITLDEEVEFSSLMLTKHKKSTETWAHRYGISPYPQFILIIINIVDGY